MVTPLVLLLIATPAFAAKNVLLDSIEAEDIEGNDWGMKVSGHPGNYGGMNANKEEDGRLVTDVGANNPAYYTFKYKGSVRELLIRHLDGIADDSFNVYLVGKKGEYYVGNYTDVGTTEKWKTSEFDLKPALRHVGHGRSIKIKIELIDENHTTWPTWTTYGQLAIDWMEVWGNGKPIA